MKERNRKLLLPFVHYRLELPELLQGVLMIAVGLSTISVLQDTLGLSYGAALAAVFIAEALGLLHILFADPVVPGWIASALSLVLVYLGGYQVGIQSIHALIALQLLVSLLFLVLGVTGLAHKLIRLVPPSLKAGILLGAAIAAMGRVFGAGGYLSKYPLSVGFGVAVALLVLFSVASKDWKSKSRAWREITKYGMLSSLIVSMAVGFLSGELPLPQLQWGFSKLDFKALFQTASVFSVGFPSLKVFLAALPTALSVYIIAFGEIITAESVLDECQQARPEVNLPFNANKTNIITGVRNLILSLICPFTALAGPLWAAVTVSIGERYKEKGSSMKSLYGGIGSFKLSAALCILLLPVTSLLAPVLPVALAVTLAVQGFACSYMAVEQVKEDRTAAGTAGVTAAVVYFAGSGWGLAVGLVSWLVLEAGYKKFKKNYSYVNERKRKNIMKSNVIITISQEYYAGGDKIAQTLADTLNIPCYNDEILQKASELSRIPYETLKKFDGVSVTAAYDLTAADESQIQLPPAKRFYDAQIAAVKALATESCVLVDRNAAEVLKTNPNHISIFLHASAVKRLNAMQAMNQGATHRDLARMDRKRRQFYRHFSENWDRAENYDLSLDLSKTSAEDAVKVILDYLGYTETRTGLAS